MHASQYDLNLRDGSHCEYSECSKCTFAHTIMWKMLWIVIVEASCKFYQYKRHFEISNNETSA